jgi:hypothetical protein
MISKKAFKTDCDKADTDLFISGSREQFLEQVQKAKSLGMLENPFVIL